MTASLNPPSPPAIPPTDRRILLEAAAGHFNLHASICRIRACRRLGACRTARADADKDDYLPPCIGCLTASDRSTIDKLLAVMGTIYHGTLWPPPAESGERKLLQAEAIAITQAALSRMPERAADFARWHARFTAPPPPPADAGAVLRQMKAELELAELARERRAVEARLAT